MKKALLILFPALFLTGCLTACEDMSAAYNLTEASSFSGSDGEGFSGESGSGDSGKADDAGNGASDRSGGSGSGDSLGTGGSSSASPGRNEGGDSPETGGSSGNGTAAGSVGSGNGQSAGSEQTGSIFVYICGAVRMPGVYELEGGSRVYQAVQAAGGLTEDADTRLINQAQLLTDGQQITVYTVEEARTIQESGGIAGTDPSGNAASENGASGDAASGKVNINQAGEEELTTLPGIGEAKARAIISYREENGGFSSIEEIKNVEGIKDKLFSQISELIEV